jgi:hypothetical protein
LVGVLSWFDDPDVSGLVRSASLGFLLLDHSRSLLKIFAKPEILLIFESFSDMEGQRDILEDIFPLEIVVLSEIVEQGLLVAKEEVVLEMVMD